LRGQEGGEEALPDKGKTNADYFERKQEKEKNTGQEQKRRPNEL